MSRSPGRQPRCLATLASGLFALAILVGPQARAAVAPGEYCVVGLGPNTSGVQDGWVAVVTPAGGVTVLVNGAPFVDPFDCTIDPTSGDVLVVDEGPGGSGTNGALYRVQTGPTVVTTILSGAPLVNPRGLAAGQDGTLYVADLGGSTGASSNDGAVYAVSPSGVPTRLDTPGILDDPVDLDLDPRPFANGLNLILVDRTSNQRIDRVPLAGGAPQNVGSLSSGRLESIEVGPYGNYFLVDRSGNRVVRFDRLTGAQTSVSNTSDPRGITVDYVTADLVVADDDTGVENVPPNAYLGGAPGPTNVAPSGALPPAPRGVGFSPPLASADPSTNLGVPTRRAPLPGGNLVVIGPASSTGNGDPEDELDLFIEVTDTSRPLRVRVFDANVRDGFDGNAGSFNTPVTYTLFDPSGAVLTSAAVPANGRVDLDQRIATLNAGNTLTVRGPGVPLADAGVYRLLVDASAGDEWHGLGVWVEEFATYSFNAATGPLHTIGPAPNLTPLDPARLFPHFERGCEYAASNFDLDLQNPANAGTTLTVTSRLGESFALTGSGQNVHVEDNLDPSPASPASRELDYGLHRLEAVMAPSAAQNNIVMVRAPDFNGWVDGGGSGVPVPVPPGNPAVNPTPSLRTSPAPAWPQTPFGPATNTFLRHFLPRYDEAPTQTAAPYAPYLTQAATPLLGDPPSVGNPARYAVQIAVVNPDPVNALTNLTVWAEVPAPAVYVDAGPGVGGGATATGGGSVTACSPTPCSGTLSATWASLAPGATEVFSYAVEVVPSAVGERLYLTGGPAVRGGGATPAANPAGGSVGTVAFFTPAWASTAFPRIESLGPLCDLSVVEGTVTPVAVELARFEAQAGDGAVRLVWETAAEIDNLGFHVHRRLEGQEGYERVTRGLILGRGTTDLSARYTFLDASVPNGVRAEYLLEDIEFDGDATRHGPVAATPRAGLELPEPSPKADAPAASSPREPEATSPAPPRTQPHASHAAPEAEPPPVTQQEAQEPASLAAEPGPDVADVLAVAALPGVKLALHGPGVTRVPASALWDAGLAPDVDPRRLRVHRQGREIAVHVEGEGDGRLDPGDALLVWSDGLDTRYSDEDVVFVVTGDGRGLRAPRLDAPPAGAAHERAVAAHARFEEQRIYLPGILNGEGDNFVGRFVFDRVVASRIPTPGANGEAALLRVRLRGGTTYAAVEPDHHFELRVGGVAVADLRFDGSESFETLVALDPGVVVGEHLDVEVVPLFDSGAPFDLIYVDAFELHYRRELVLEDGDGGALVFEAEANAPHRVTGLLDPSRAGIWDVTEPDAPLQLSGLAEAPDALVFQAEAGARYAVVEGEGERAPARVVANLPSRWSEEARGADWVVIADGALLAEAERLAAARERRGLRTAVIDVEDVYDERTGGVFTPLAIRDLVRALASAGDGTPRHLLLAGEASYDYRDFLGGQATIGVPSMLVDTTFVETASDSWFGDLDGDGAPELAVGRIPARTPEELAAVVDKLVAYEAEAERPAQPDSWRARLLLVADDGLGAGDPREARSFEAVLDAVAATLSPDLGVRSLRLSELPEVGQGDAARATIHDALRAGLAFLLYAGHGGARVWADELIHGVDDVLEVPTGAALPLYLVLNCLNAFFDAPNEESLAEVALRAVDRGAAGFVSSTAVSAFEGQDAFAHALAEKLFAAGTEVVGDALREAQRTIVGQEGAEDVLASFVLIGDPATRLALPRVPVADPGPDRSGKLDTAIPLDGGASRSPRDAPLAYAWRLVQEPEPGAGVVRGDSDSRARLVGSVPGRYVVELRVHDGHWSSPPAEVQVEVTGEARVAWSCGGPAPGEDPTRLSGLDLVYLAVPAGASAALRRRRRTRWPG